jgi:hypothetical protein
LSAGRESNVGYRGITAICFGVISDASPEVQLGLRLHIKDEKGEKMRNFREKIKKELKREFRQICKES